MICIGINKGVPFFFDSSAQSSEKSAISVLFYAEFGLKFSDYFLLFLKFNNEFKYFICVGTVLKQRRAVAPSFTNIF